MKKHVLLTSLFAIAATVSAARAETDVTFAGDYLLGDGVTVANVGTELDGATYMYTYSKTNGDTVTVAQNVDPVLSYFTYTDKNNDSATLATGGVELTASDFDGTTTADGTNVISHQTIEAGQTIVRSNYEYVNGKGETVTLGETAQSFAETVVLDPTYSTVVSVDVTDGSAAPVLTGDMYSYTDPDTGAVYHLNAAGDEWVDANNLVVTPDVGTPQEAARDDMVLKFAADQAAIAAAKILVDDYAAAEVTAFAAADQVFSDDGDIISDLTTRYGTYTDALDDLQTAKNAQSARQGEFGADQLLETAAASVYNAPIEATLDATVQRANDYADSLASNYDAAGAADAAEANANAYADSLAANYDVAGAADTAEANANAYADSLASNYDVAGAADAEQTRAIAAEGKLQTNIDTEVARAKAAEGVLQSNIDAEALARANADTALQSKIDNEVARATAQEAAIRSEFAAADAQTLANANAYTDNRVNEMEKNVSGGVAAATALSAVNVSGVQKGEVSVGGGYGYYNSQSAVAFGAAMGLSDRWSVNAGAGIASGDKTQVTFRAGTNYKFKLF